MHELSALSDVAAGLNGEDFDPSRPWVLIAEDDRGLAEDLGVLLTRELDVATRIARTGHQLLAMVEHSPPLLLLLDLTLPGLFGTSAAITIRQRWRDLPIIVVSGRSPLEVAMEAETIDAPYVMKPFDVGQLLKLIKTTIS